MCRWFAYISPKEPCLLKDVLITPANSIAKQCSEHYLPGLLPHRGEKDLIHSPDKFIRMRNSLLNVDGLGIAWYTKASASYVTGVEGPRPAVYKTQQPATHDLNALSICENIESTCVFAHVRATSGAVIAEANCHPFRFGRHLFMHNGVISDFSQIHRDMVRWASYDAFCNILGSTDSELAAALYITNLTGGGDRTTWDEQYPLNEMLAALTKTIHQILELQARVVGEKAAPNSLNFCVTDGEQMIGVRFRNHASQQPPSLYWSETAGRSLNQKYPGNPDFPVEIDEEVLNDAKNRIGKHTIIASEPTTYDRKQWQLIKKNCALLVDRFGIETEVPISYDGKYNCEDPWENWNPKTQ